MLRSLYVIFVLFATLPTLSFGQALILGDTETEAAQTQTAPPVTRMAFEFEQRELFRKADKNLDGKVTFQETIDLKNEKLAERLSMQFKELDKDLSLIHI